MQVAVPIPDGILQSAARLIDTRNQRYGTGHPSAERRIYVGRFAPRPAVGVDGMAHAISFEKTADEFATAG